MSAAVAPSIVWVTCLAADGSECCGEPKPPLVPQPRHGLVSAGPAGTQGSNTTPVGCRSGISGGKSNSRRFADSVGETSEVRTPLPSRIPQNIHALNCFLLRTHAWTLRERSGPASRKAIGQSRAVAAASAPGLVAAGGARRSVESHGRAMMPPSRSRSTNQGTCPSPKNASNAGPTDRSTSCPQKQSSPYIRRVQYTVLSVAG